MIDLKELKRFKHDQYVINHSDRSAYHAAALGAGIGFLLCGGFGYWPLAELPFWAAFPLIIVGLSLCWRGGGGLISLDRRIRDFNELIMPHIQELEYLMIRPNEELVATNGSHDPLPGIYLEDSKGGAKSWTLFLGKLKTSQYAEPIKRYAQALLDKETTFSRESAEAYGVPRDIFSAWQHRFNYKNWAYKTRPGVKNSPWNFANDGYEKLEQIANIPLPHQRQKSTQRHLPD